MSAGAARAKVWLFILTLLAGLALLATLLLLPEVNRARRDELTARIQLAHRTSALLLAEQAHKLVAAATQLSSDAVLRTSLEEMPRGQAELEVLHKTAQAQLAHHNRELKAAFLLVTDARGFVLSRVGQDEAVYRDPLDGWPLVSDALRGYRLDDLWLWQGTLYRVAAAPVISVSRDRYVGALLVAQVVGSDLAQGIATATGLDVAVLCSGQVIGSSTRSPGDPLATEALLKLRQQSKSATVSMGPASDELSMFLDLPGSAATQGATLALIGKGPQAVSALSTLSRSAARGLPTSSLLGLLLTMAVLLGIGLLMLRGDGPAPAPVLLPPVFPPDEPLPEVGSQQLPLPLTSPTTTAPAPSSVSPPLLIETVSVAAAPPPPLPPPLPPASVRRPSDPALRPAAGYLTPALGMTPAPSALTDPGLKPEFVDGPRPESTEFSDETRVAAGPAAEGDPEAGFYRVFQEFVQARERCGESVAGLQFDRFRRRLLDSRAQITSQHGCRDVQFHVHIKEGRAGLRATPVW